jgi:adenylosuccinate synthase
MFKNKYNLILMVEYVDICCGLAWGDEAKGKLVSYLSKNNDYDFVCRWAGGNNAGHTIYINNIKYKTHLIPSGVFHNIKSIIGPDCVVNIKSFFEELEYLKSNNFNTSLVKISPKAHIITDNHIEEDKLKYGALGTTSRGIAPCYRDKFGRTGIRAESCDELKDYIWDEKLYGKILCEGAQGFWLDINYGNYPYITSSTTLPYGACCLGFPPQKIRKIYGAAKIYDTRAGVDPDFPEDLLENPLIKQVILEGKEYGTTTGRMRKVNWLNLDKLISAINISGCTDLIISKVDVLDKLQFYKLIYMNIIHNFETMNDMKNNILDVLKKNCPLLLDIKFSQHLEDI